MVRFILNAEARDRDAIRAMVERRDKAEAASKPRRQRKHPEQDLQIAVAAFLRVATIRPARWFFCPNGGNLSKVQRAMFQKMGLTPGVSDLHFAWEQKAQHGVELSWARYGVIELKAANGKLSPEQEDFLDDMNRIGHRHAVCRTLDEVVNTLKAWGFPLRARPT